MATLKFLSNFNTSPQYNQTSTGSIQSYHNPNYTKTNNMIALNYILDRLAEASTWRGLAFVLSAAGIALVPDQANAIAAAGMAVVGAINVFRKEKK